MMPFFTEFKLTRRGSVRNRQVLEDWMDGTPIGWNHTHDNHVPPVHVLPSFPHSSRWPD